MTHKIFVKVKDILFLFCLYEIQATLINGAVIPLDGISSDITLDFFDILTLSCS